MINLTKKKNGSRKNNFKSRHKFSKSRKNVLKSKKNMKGGNPFKNPFKGIFKTKKKAPKAPKPPPLPSIQKISNIGLSKQSSNHFKKSGANLYATIPENIYEKVGVKSGIQKTAENLERKLTHKNNPYENMSGSVRLRLNESGKIITQKPLILKPKLTLEQMAHESAIQKLKNSKLLTTNNVPKEHTPLYNKLITTFLERRKNPELVRKTFSNLNLEKSEIPVIENPYVQFADKPKNIYGSLKRETPTTSVITQSENIYSILRREPPITTEI